MVIPWPCNGIPAGHGATATVGNRDDAQQPGRRWYYGKKTDLSSRLNRRPGNPVEEHGSGIRPVANLSLRDASFNGPSGRIRRRAGRFGGDGRVVHPAHRRRAAHCSLVFLSGIINTTGLRAIGRMRHMKHAVQLGNNACMGQSEKGTRKLSPFF